eukprot:TRINITY_DN545_c0_g1_i1.p1 TRINITY_DN545_c0_g1~~TRINITY_DN545_c0_g1_i1.p1  ORF type:complete len:531 (+),score=139.84 TRINITY_DN545_c0_g1_i1:67-1659(+)
MAARPQPVVEGVVFPQNEKGERSTSDVAKKIFAATFEANNENQLAKNVLQERNWRYGYVKHILKHVETSLKSPEAAINAASAGLDYMHENFEFIRDGKTMKFSEAMKAFKGTFHTGFIKGTKPKTTPELVVPYKGKQLRGEALIQQVNKWANYGTIEPDTAEAIIKVVQNPKWTDLSDRYFVILGAGSAMGPFLVLMALGANIIAVDLDRAPIWKRLISIAEQSSGTITFPLKKPQSEITSNDDLYANAGSNLITQAPEINNWLCSLYPEKNLLVGCYVYLDGDAHVKVVMACDAIMKGMSETRKAGLAYLCTPTDAHVIPEEARRAAAANYNALTWQNMLVLPIRTILGSRMLAKNAQRPVKAKDGQEFSYVDGLVVQQGPNYALAKRMQHWRAMVARSKGCLVSSHIAPSTATASVVHNKSFAWAYDGIPYFKPYEIFEQDTSNAVMSAILIHDINNPKAAANPTFPLHNPLELFKYNSFNGGVWRSGYKYGTLGEISVIIHFVKVLRPALLVLFLFVVYFLYSRFSS